MRKLFTFYFLIISNLTFSQVSSSEITVRVNQLLFFDASETVNSDSLDLFISPYEEDVGKTFDIDLSYSYPIQTKSLLFRIGYSQINQKGRLIRVRDTSYLESLNYRKQKIISLSLGLNHSVKLDDKHFCINGAASLMFQYKFKNQNDFFSNLFNGNDKYLGGTERLISNPNSWRGGINLEVGFSYLLTEKLGLGFSINNFIFIDRLKGNTIEKRNVLDENQNIFSTLSINHFEKRSRFSKNFSFSIFLTYKINKNEK